VSYRLRVTARSVGEADEAYAWMTEHFSPAVAERWYRGLFEQLETLGRHPLLCPRAAESEKVSEEIREQIYGKGKNKYRILFAIRQRDVVVLSIHHAAWGEWLL